MTALRAMTTADIPVDRPLAPMPMSTAVVGSEAVESMFSTRAMAERFLP